MDLGPIAGIRSVSLLHVQRAQDPVPQFQVDASERSDDEPESSNQQSFEDEFQEAGEALEQAKAKDEDQEPEDMAEGGGFDWFA